MEGDLFFCRQIFLNHNFSVEKIFDVALDDLVPILILLKHDCTHDFFSEVQTLLAITISVSQPWHVNYHCLSGVLSGQGTLHNIGALPSEVLHHTLMQGVCQLRLIYFDRVRRLKLRLLHH